LVRAEIEGIICSGKSIGNKRSFALLAERVPNTGKVTRDIALAKLAGIYFASHSPATLQDFVWWSGLSVTESKQALEMIKSELISEKIDNQTYWITNSLTGPDTYKDQIYLLPAFDEFIISYKDRKPSLTSEHHSRAVSSNGIFRPIIVSNGHVIGIWRQAVKNGKVVLETVSFGSDLMEQKHLIAKASSAYSHFIQREVEIA
jgi:hypothetical protein